MNFDCLSLDAACFMIVENLMIRNSFTEQVRSLHYEFNDHCSSHSPGGGCYGIPLWTIAIPNLFTPNDSKGVISDGDKVKNEIDEYFKEVDCTWPPSNEQKISQLYKLGPAEQKQYFAKFLAQIKKHIQPYTSFGTHFEGLFNYELLIANSKTPYLNDYGRYSTGGRTVDKFSRKTIVYRATFNKIEIKFLKAIIGHQYDNELPNLIGLAENVADSVRYQVCNQLCTEIISAKLVIFLNSKGNPQKVITLSKDNLVSLLQKALLIVKSELDEIIDEKLILVSRASHSPQDYLDSKKYKTPLKVAQVKSNSAEKQLPRSLSPSKSPFFESSARKQEETKPDNQPVGQSPEVSQIGWCAIL